jgi:hypothetical protein
MSKVFVEIDHCFINNNLRYAINLPSREMKALLKTKYKDPMKFIIGKIGDEWGTVNLNNKSTGCCGIRRKIVNNDETLIDSPRENKKAKCFPFG